MRINVPALLQHSARRNSVGLSLAGNHSPGTGPVRWRYLLEKYDKGFYPLSPRWSPIHLSAPFYLSQKINEANEFTVMQI